MASDPWVLALDANHASAGERAVFTRLAPTLRGSECRILVETCHRAELYGFGDLPGHFACLGSTRILVAEMAVRHLMRVAAGLESVVVGEEQVLHQVRMALAARPPSVPLELTRLFETAISCGRRARAARARKSLDLATIAVRWLAQRRRLRDRRVLVVGAGRMGTAGAPFGGSADYRRQPFPHSCPGHCQPLRRQLGGSCRGGPPGPSMLRHCCRARRPLGRPRAYRHSSAADGRPLFAGSRDKARRRG
jgi:hypothetical protein